MAGTGRIKAWQALVKKNYVVPVAFDRQRELDEDSEPFCLCIKSVDGVIPKAELRNADYQLRISLFDVTYKQFFGKTWVGPPVRAKMVGQKSRLVYNQNVYFHSSLNDESIAAVVEIIAVARMEDGSAQQVSCGWGMFRIFKYEGKMKDSSSPTPAPAHRIDIYHGTPRCLLFVDEPIEDTTPLKTLRNENMTLINGCQVIYSIQTHHALTRAMHLLPENVLVGGTDVIPGLQDGVKDPKTGMIDNLRKPKLLKKMPCFLERLQVSLPPNIDKLEEDMCQRLNEDRINRENNIADGTTISVIERRLQVGVHNGWSYVDKPEVVHVSPDSAGQKGSSLRRGSTRGHQRTPSSSSLNSGLSGATCLTHKNRIQLDEMLEDASFTVVFVLEYVLGEPKGKDKKSKSATYNVSIRWAAWSPLSNLDQSEHTIQLMGGPSPIPDQVFVYDQSGESIGSSASLAMGSGGTLSFTVQYPNKEKPLAAVSSASLSVPQLNLPPDSGRAASKMSVETEDSGALQAVQVSARPPIPARPGTGGSGYSDNHQVMPPYMGGSMPGPQGMYPQAQMYAQQGYMTSPMGPYGGGYAAMPSYQPSPRGYIPVEIAHVSDTGMQSSRPGGADLQELPFTPVHAPIMASVPGHRHGQGLTRSAYARLFTAGFPPILDRHGEAPDVVDPADTPPFILAKEEMDPFQTNEIVMQLLAFSRVLSFESGRDKKSPSTVFFTFQFYRFPQVTTERLLLGNVEGGLSNDPNSLPCILQKLGKDGSVMKGPPGYQVKYHVDPAYLKPGEGRLFVQHLSQQTLHLDVWDGDSLLLIGSAAVDLKTLCRQGREGVQVMYELDVVATDYVEPESPVPSGDVTREGFVKPMDVQTVVKGRLHLRLANIGHPADPKLSKADRMSVPTKPKLIVTQENNGNSSFLGGSLNAITSHSNALKASKKSKAMHMAETNQELAAALFTRKNKSEQKMSETNSARQSKLSRMQAVRQTEGEDTTTVIGSFRQEKEIRARDLKTISMYREQNKREGIMNMLNQAITTEHVLHPSLGTTEFFEYVLRNPYNVPHTVTIECEDPELNVITDAREWRHFKMINELYTSIEEGMFSKQSKSGFPELYLRPKESVNIPFRLLTMKADHAVHPQQPSDPFKPQAAKSAFSGARKDDPMETRLVKVLFKTEQGKPINILAVRIEPQPHIIDQTFRFHHPEQTFLKKSVRLPPLHTLPGMPIGGAEIQQVYVRCSDPNVICESKKVQKGEPHDVFIKVACGASPQIKKFFVAVYSDMFLSRPIQIWQFYTHALQRVDISCIEGQTSRVTLILRGTQASRLVQCFSSHPPEMQVEPRDAFMLPASTLQEIHCGVRPAAAGTKFLYINVVDIEYHQLIRTWLVCVMCKTPIISKAYELQLPIGGGKGSNKRIAYTNPYPNTKVFNLRSNRPDLLQFKETRLEMASGQSHNLGLRFAPTQTPGTAEILVFINDEDDKNEETFCVRATYG